MRNTRFTNFYTARGTGEPVLPSYGIIVGDPLFAATRRLIPGLTGYKVNYPASFQAASKIAGVDDAAAYLEKKSQACPDQKYVLVGYSQGADVMHGAAAKINAALYPRIVAIVMFGDPGNKGPSAVSPLGGPVPVFPAELQSKLKENCAPGDPICSAGTNRGAHLTYSTGDYMSSSAGYIKKQFETGGKAGASPSPVSGTSS